MPRKPARHRSRVAGVSFRPQPAPARPRARAGKQKLAGAGAGDRAFALRGRCGCVPLSGGQGAVRENGRQLPLEHHAERPAHHEALVLRHRGQARTHPPRQRQGKLASRRHEFFVRRF